MRHTYGKRRKGALRTRGQSIPLLALMITAIVAMVGLSVDVGNTFAEERRAVAAANAAAMAGMQVYLNRSETTSHKHIYDAIVGALRDGGVQVAQYNTEPRPGEVRLRATYLDAQARPIAEITPSSNLLSTDLQNRVAFIQVDLDGRVGTFFARVVGRNDLPFNALSHAGVCPSTAGVYPITVNADVLDGNRFRNPNDPDANWREMDYTSADMVGRFTAMRLTVSGETTPGNFSWLRWRDSIPGATSEQRLAESLRGEGNLGEGFEEAPWPNANDRPTVYPEQPGVLNVGDWVWGATGYMQSSDVRTALDAHIQAGTRMILPIHSNAVLQGNNSRFHISRLGLFVLLGYGRTQNDKWLDLLFLGDARPQQRPCLYTGVIEPNTEDVVELVGSVSFWPEYAYRPQTRQPIQYVVVLDTSGSMSADFEGRCDRGPNIPSRGWVRCAGAPPGATEAPQVETDGTGQFYYWSNVDERRITVAKRALVRLVQSTNMQGNAEYDANRPPDQMALVWFTNTASQNQTLGFTSNRNTLINTINQANRYANDNYRTIGGTNGAGALYRAAVMFDQAPNTVNYRGRTWQYKRVVIFVTDGVSNWFLNTANDSLAGRQSNWETYPVGHTCRNFRRPSLRDPNVIMDLSIEIIQCQITGDEATGVGRWNGMDRPVTQQIQISRQELQRRGVEVYVVALSNIPETGLRDGVASFPSYFFSARDLQRNADGTTNVDAIMQAINTRVETGTCQPRNDGAWKSTIGQNEFQSVGSLQYPTVGEVLLEDQSTGTRYRAPIVADASRGGALTYRFDRLPAGAYRLRAYLFYRHPEDLASAGPRRYGLIYQNETAISEMTLNIAPERNRSGFTRSLRRDLQLRLSGDVCAQQ